MASYDGNRFRTDILKGVHDLTSNAIKVLAVNAAFFSSGFTTEDAIRSIDFISALKSPTDYELSGTGYARQTLASKTVTQNNTAGVNRGVFDAADITFTGINAGTIAGLVFLRDRGGADSANEFLWIDDNADLVTNGADVDVIWSANGIFRL